LGCHARKDELPSFGEDERLQATTRSIIAQAKEFYP